MGGEAGTQEFLRLFMVPGMDHCGIQAGPGIRDTGMDPLAALEDWVENDRPPASLLVTKRDPASTVEWTRPLCPFPQVARYNGRGNVNDAASFRCVRP